MQEQILKASIRPWLMISTEVLPFSVFTGAVFEQIGKKLLSPFSLCGHSRVSQHVPAGAKPVAFSWIKLPKLSALNKSQNPSGLGRKGP